MGSQRVRHDLVTKQQQSQGARDPSYSQAPSPGKLPWKDQSLKGLYMGTSLVAQMIESLPAIQEIGVWSLGQEDLLEKGMATHSSILSWKTQWMEEPGRPQSLCMGDPEGYLKQGLWSLIAQYKSSQAPSSRTEVVIWKSLAQIHSCIWNPPRDLGSRYLGELILPQGHWCW